MMFQLQSGQVRLMWLRTVPLLWQIARLLHAGRVSGLLLLLSVFLAVPVMAKAVAEPVRLVTKHWPGYTNTDHTGGYFELVQLVLPAMQYQLDTQFSNFSRAVILVQKEQAELVLAVTRVDGKQLLLSEYPIDADTIIAVYRDNLSPVAATKPLTLAQLSQYRLAWDLAYNYGQALGLQVSGYEVADVSQGLELVSKGRVDVYLAEQSELELPAAMLLLQHLKLQHTQIQQLPVYVGFSRSAKGLRLKRSWDQQFRLLLQQGKLQTLYAAYPGMVLPRAVPECTESACENR